MNIGDVVQFNENHKWCGCLGIINEMKELSNGDIRFMVGIPMPENGTAYIFAMGNEIEFVGRALLVPKNEED